MFALRLFQFACFLFSQSLLEGTDEPCCRLPLPFRPLSVVGEGDLRNWHGDPSLLGLFVFFPCLVPEGRAPGIRHFFPAPEAKSTYFSFFPYPPRRQRVQRGGIRALQEKPLSPLPLSLVSFGVRLPLTPARGVSSLSFFLFSPANFDSSAPRLPAVSAELFLLSPRIALPAPLLVPKSTLFFF